MNLYQAYDVGRRHALEKFAMQRAKTLPSVSHARLTVGPDPGNPKAKAVLGEGDIHPSREPLSHSNPNPIAGTAKALPQTSLGKQGGWRKFALNPPTQVDDFIANVEHAQDVPPMSAEPPMSHPPGEALPALDGTIPLEMQSTSPQTPPGMGSTVGEAPQPPPSMGALGG